MGLDPFDLGLGGDPAQTQPCLPVTVEVEVGFTARSGDLGTPGKAWRLGVELTATLRPEGATPNAP
jgi:hypothetical protein